MENEHLTARDNVRLNYESFYQYVCSILPVLGREHIEKCIAEIIETNKTRSSSDEIIAFDVNYDLTFLKGKDAILDFFGRFPNIEEHFKCSPCWGVPSKDAEDVKHITFDELLSLAEVAGEDVEMKTTLTFGINGNVTFLTLSILGINSGTLYAQNNTMI